MRKKIVVLCAAWAAFLGAEGAEVTVDGVKYMCDESAHVATVCAATSDITVADIQAVVAVDGAEYTVTSIAERGFYVCRSLASVSVPASVVSAGSNAFLGCSALHEVSISDLAAWCDIDFAGGFANPLVNGADLIINGEKADKIVLPASLTAINSDAFCGCNMTEVVIPEGVTEIGERAFYGCSKLAQITIPGSVKTIGISAFDGCASLTEAMLQQGVDEIGSYAFSDCSALKTVTLPASVTTIGNSAFAGCSALQAVNIDNVAGFCCINFGNADSNPLATAHHLYIDGAEVTDIDTGDECTKIVANMFAECPAIKSVRIGTSVQDLGDSAFEGCSNLTAVNIDGPVTKLTTGVFGDCPALQHISLPNTLTEIAFGAFYGCTSLQAITLPASLATIGKSAFYGCSNLSEVTVLATTPPAAKSNSFSRYDATLKVPESALATYKADEVWSQFEKITATNGVSDITCDNPVDTPAVYYDLQGRRVTSPTPGTILITKGDKTRQ